MHFVILNCCHNCLASKLKSWKRIDYVHLHKALVNKSLVRSVLNLKLHVFRTSPFSLVVEPTARLVNWFPHLNVFWWHVWQIKKHEFLIKAFRLAVKLQAEIATLYWCNGHNKHFWRRIREADHYGFRASLLIWLYYWNICPAHIHLTFKLFSVHRGSFWQCFGPNCSSQGVFTSSAL